MTFQIRALPAGQFAHLTQLSDAELAAQNIHKRVVDAHPGYPCRVSLQDADIGETVFLLHHCHHDEATPYRASHAIFVRRVRHKPSRNWARCRNPSHCG